MQQDIQDRKTDKTGRQTIHWFLYEIKKKIVVAATKINLPWDWSYEIRVFFVFLSC